MNNPAQVKSRADFESLFRTWYSPLCAYANQFLKDQDAAEEVVQEVMFKVWTSRETLVITVSMKGYLYRSVRNGCMNVISHLKVRDDYRNRHQHTGDAGILSSEDEMIASELEMKIREAIDHLPVGRRRVFIMSRYDGLTYQQIAEKLGVSVKTVENQMGHALKAMREELKDYLPWIVLFFSHVFKG